MSDADYIEVLIKAERSEAKPGWKERVFHLENQLEMAKTAAAAKDPNYDPFKDYQTEDWLIFFKSVNSPRAPEHML
jgi:hypothetical protein